jgi:hypothetical protein
MTDKHTPGPWRLKIKRDSFDGCTRGHIYGKGNATSFLSIPMENDTSRATARLIVEAPAMLATLRSIRAIVAEGSSVWEFADKMIKRVEGGEGGEK